MIRHEVKSCDSTVKTISSLLLLFLVLEVVINLTVLGFKSIKNITGNNQVSANPIVERRKPDDNKFHADQKKISKPKGKNEKVVKNVDTQ